MHVFIYGERGIGKTSIALTSAKAFIKREPPYIGCDGHVTFSGLVGDLCRALMAQPYLSKDKSVSHTASLNMGVLKGEAKFSGTGHMSIPEKIASVNQAASC